MVLVYYRFNLSGYRHRLCRSFCSYSYGAYDYRVVPVFPGGGTGAYQATAIALASDILGYAVTSYTYARHKNIDIRRGWLIMTCILVLSTVGSYVAFLAGNVVLGGFDCIGSFYDPVKLLGNHIKIYTLCAGTMLCWNTGRPLIAIAAIIMWALALSLVQEQSYLRPANTIRSALEVIDELMEEHKQ